MAGGAFGEGGEEFAGVGGPAAYVVLGLTEGGMRAQQFERLGQALVVGEVGVEQLEQPRVGRVARDPPGRGRSAPAGSGRPRAGRCPGVLPDSSDSEAMSRMSSDSWKATPISSPKARSDLLRPRPAHRRPGAEAARRWRSASRSCRRRRQVVRQRVLAFGGAEGLADLALDQAARRSAPGSGPRPGRGRRPGRRPGRTASRRSGSRPSCPSGRSRWRRPGAASASSITSSW